MAWGFDDILANDSQAFLDAFGENVQAVYLPAGGTPRPITVIVERRAPEIIRKGERGATNALLIRVANNSVTGISATEFDSGADKIQIAVELGGDLLTRNFSNDKAMQDGGMLAIKVM